MCNLAVLATPDTSCAHTAPDTSCAHTLQPVPLCEVQTRPRRFATCLRTFSSLSSVLLLQKDEEYEYEYEEEEEVVVGGAFVYFF